MSQPTPSSVPYRVLPSAHVIRELEALMRRAYAAGHSKEALAALKEIEHRLSIYPQFGEKLRDLRQTGETLWVATVPPLVAEYVIDESIRSVFIARPFKVLSNAGFK